MKSPAEALGGRRRPGSVRHRVRGQRGAAGVLVLGVLAALCLPLGAGVARVGAAARDRARADASADLTALATVTGGAGAGEEVARANGARLVEVTTGADASVEVVVRRGSVAATAAAAPAG